MKVSSKTHADYWSAFEHEYQGFKRAANRHRHAFYALQTAHVLFAAAVPVILILDHENANLVGAIVSALSTLFFSMLRLFKVKQNWLLNERIAHDLMREKTLFQESAGEYRVGAKAYGTFIENVERLKKTGFVHWANVNSEADELKKAS